MINTTSRHVSSSPAANKPIKPLPVPKNNVSSKQILRHQGTRVWEESAGNVRLSIGWGGGRLYHSCDLTSILHHILPETYFCCMLPLRYGPNRHVFFHFLLHHAVRPQGWSSGCRNVHKIQDIEHIVISILIVFCAWKLVLPSATKYGKWNWVCIGS